jgi:carotenoid 1,2-hydratase
MAGPTFDARAEVDAVPARGYRWWYVDGLSDDGQRGFTVIYMYGHVFSPWRARRVRRGEPVIAREHLGMHVALYEHEREVAWAMSEYGAAALRTEAQTLHIGDSMLRAEGDGVAGVIAERGAPIFWSRAFGLGGAIRGRFTLTPSGPPPAADFEIGRSAAGEAHRWQVRIPSGRIRVEFDAPGFSFEGHGYHDTNWGEGRLEDAFSRWSWARFHEADRSRILYGVEGRDGAQRGYYVEAGEQRAGEARQTGAVHFGEPEATGWGLRAPRGFELERAGRAEVVRWLDRTPFYARYVARLGEVEGVGEFLDLVRLQRPTVQFLLRWRGHRRGAPKEP